MREGASHHSPGQSQRHSETATSILFVPVLCRAPIAHSSLHSTAAVSPSGFCFFGRGSDSGDALKNRSSLRLLHCFSFSSFLSNSSSHLISITSHHRRIVIDPLSPLIPPNLSRTILLSSCTLTVSDYIQSTICKTSSVFCFVSSFLSAFCKFQPESWKEKKKKKKASRLQLSIGYSPFCPERICFCCLFFLASFPSSFCTCSCTCTTPIQKTTGSPLHLISFVVAAFVLLVSPSRIAIPDVLRLTSTAFHWTLWTLFLFYFPDSALSILTVANYDV